MIRKTLISALLLHFMLTGNAVASLAEDKRLAILKNELQANEVELMTAQAELPKTKDQTALLERIRVLEANKRDLNIEIQNTGRIPQASFVARKKTAPKKEISEAVSTETPTASENNWDIFGNFNGGN